MSKPGGDPTSGISSVDVLIPTERHPACRQREARSGSCTERENLADDAKGKGTSGATARPKVPMRRRGADRPVVTTMRGNARWSKGGGSSPLSLGQLGHREEPEISAEGGSLHAMTRAV